ncbi:MAG: hypothetical protein QM703_16365 [Gemmatales bacterium]
MEEINVVAAPWYLLAAGIGLVILGYFLSVMMRPSDSSRQVIDEEMDDDEIAEQLNSGNRWSFAGMLILLGMGCALVSIVWRLVLLVARNV